MKTELSIEDNKRLSDIAAEISRDQLPVFAKQVIKHSSAATASDLVAEAFAAGIKFALVFVESGNPGIKLMMVRKNENNQ